jgi:AcrR family transcriptional regulator
MTEQSLPVQPEYSAVRNRLLTAASQLFTSKGYAATTVREIVDTAGVTKPVLYYYFGSKGGLYLELMNSSYAILEGIIAEIIATPGSSRERIIRFCTGVYDGSMERIEVVRLIYSIYYGPPQGAPPFSHDQLFDRLLEILEALISEGVRSGELQKVNERDASWAIVGGLTVVLEEQLCHSPPRIGRDGMVRMLNLMFSGIGQGEGK